MQIIVYIMLPIALECETHGMYSSLSNYDDKVTESLKWLASGLLIGLAFFIPKWFKTF